MKSIEKILALLSLCALIFCFVMGNMRSQNALGFQIKSIIPSLSSYNPLTPDLCEVIGANNERYIFATAVHPGYAGPMLTGIVVNVVEGKGIIESVAIIDSPDTSPYIKQVLDAKIPDAYLSKSIEDMPDPKAVSGATLSSDALKIGIQKASAKIMANEEIAELFPDLMIDANNLSKAKILLESQNSINLSSAELLKVGLVLIFFALTAFVASKKFPFSKKKARYAILIASVVLLGFMYGTQFSISTMILLVSGAWIVGLASYAPLICLVLAILVFLFTKKNLYCNYICPFGAVQEGVSMITSCKNPVQNPLTKWVSRFFALGVICFALYFSSPSAATYEPFGKTFNFVGSLTFFMLSGSVIVFSLFLQKPWCRLFCPMTPFFDYIYFWRNWLFGSKTKPASQQN